MKSNRKKQPTECFLNFLLGTASFLLIVFSVLGIFFMLLLFDSHQGHDTTESYDINQEYSHAEEIIVYTTDTGECYHSKNCSSLRKTRHSKTLETAIKQGYSACNNCDPPTSYSDN